MCVRDRTGSSESSFFFQAEDGIRDFCLSRGLGDVYKRQETLSADSDAEYCRVLHYDVSQLEPLASCPDAPDNVKPVQKIAGTHVDQVHIGSCSNGRYEDIKAAHEVLMAGGGKVNPNTRVIITPSTTEVPVSYTHLTLPTNREG